MVDYSGFTRGEYHIVCVDLSAPRGGGWKETGDCDPLSLSNTSPDPFGGSAAAGHICCRGGQGFSQLYSGAGRSSPVPNFVQLSVFGLRSLAFQSGCWAMVVRFSLLVGRSFVPAATWCFAFSFVGFALTAVGSLL